MRVAVCQFGAAPEVHENILTIQTFAQQARDRGADLLVCPEASMSRLPVEKSDQLPNSEPLDGSFGTALADATDGSKLTIIAGGFTPASGNKVKNTLFVASNGVISAHYDKVHLYDAFDARESDNVIPADIEPTVIDVNGVAVGLATCYDLRFPEMFRLLVDQGAKVFALPAAWIRGPDKEEHWLTLLKARAIENTCFFVGSGECGDRSIGRSAVFDPMGLQLADLGSKTGIVFVDIDIDEVDRTRAVNPSLDNRRIPVGGNRDGS